jgi:two-component system chemotaxis sensor kinase CheA
MANVLNKIRHDLNGLQPDDQSTLVQIGAALQQMVSELPAEATVTQELLMSCLYGLQAIYQKNYGDFGQLKQAIETATIAAEQCLGSPENPVCQMMAQQARQVLSNVLTTDTQAAAEESAATADDAVPPLPLPAIQTLDEASAFFMQVQPHDAAALVHLRDALKTIATNETLPTEVKKLIIKAGKTAEQILRGKVAEPAAALTTIGDWLSEAALAQEFALHETTPNTESTTPAAAPAPTAVEPPPACATTPAMAAQPLPAPADFTLLPADADIALLGEFVVESREYIEGAEAALLSLENDPDDLESVNTVFRAFHTIKGTAAFLGLDPLAKLAHLAESLLSRVRDREIRCAGGYAELALHSADTLKELLEGVQQALQGAAPPKPALYDELMRVLANPEAAGVSAEKNTADTMTVVAPESDGAVETDVADEPTAAESVPSPAKALRVSAVHNAPRSPARPATAVSATESFVRVRTDRLDSLIDIVGELVIAQSMLAQDETVVSSGQQDLARKAAHAGKIVRELQDLSMGMRMVPLKATFQKMARLVRDVAQKAASSSNSRPKAKTPKLTATWWTSSATRSST